MIRPPPRSTLFPSTTLFRSVRVPLYHPGREKATRMELRCPDPACNPYLTFAVLLQAGLEGIEKGYELPEPMEKNLYHLSRSEEHTSELQSPDHLVCRLLLEN